MSVVFALHDANEQTLLETEADAHVGASPVVVGELDRCSFSMTGTESELETRIHLGHVEVEERPRRFGRKTFWPECAYFESARGPVEVRLETKRLGETFWHTRATVRVWVNPTKLNEQRYERMFGDIRSLSVGLVFDLVSKSTRGFDTTLSLGGVSGRSNQLELKVLARLWDSIAGCVTAIARAPTSRVMRRTEIRDCWGSERLHKDSSTMLARAGADPRRLGQPRPFRALRDILVESNDTAENRFVLWFLCFITHRLDQCREGAADEAEEINGLRGLRGSLFDAIDVPRLRQLDDAGRVAKATKREIERVMNSHAFAGIPSTFAAPRTAVFSNLPAYRRFLVEAEGYLNSSYVILDNGLSAHVKGTSRLYEQWVFIQVVSAMRELGFVAAGGENFIQRQGGRDVRFSVDIARGTRIDFAAARNRTITISYEPWIHPYDSAQTRRDRLFRSTPGRPYSPDVLIEVLRNDAETSLSSTVEAAMVIDAKYTSWLREEMWDRMSRYLDIRTVRTGEQLNQVWVAWPRDEAIRPRDVSVAWSSDGPSCSRRDRVLGSVGVVPDSGDRPEDAPIEAAQRMVRFIRGMTKYYDVQPA